MKKKIILGVIALLLMSVSVNIPQEALEQIYCKISPSECSESEN